MTSVNDESDPRHVAWLIDHAMRRLRNELDADLGDRYPQLRGSHFRLLTLLPEEGAPHRHLAQRAFMTKQALGQLAAHLEKHGFIETLRDPRDRRVRVIRATATGRRARKAAEEAIADLERRWAAQVGAQDFALFRRVLTAVATEWQR